eukprot:TRINITY_DN72031_c0_g1_i1.p1 TRINITY_DN72031_c0_g1~~TRINITY_DN72031_c0_g1_i1.p1  ORF type:complete len:126 (+),score=21.65 TRINITY_DN72031_c0_g1_i1:2-379(+)
MRAGEVGQCHNNAIGGRTMTLSLKKELQGPVEDVAALMGDIQELRKDMAKVLRKVRAQTSDHIDTVSDIAESISDGAASYYKDARKRGMKQYKVWNRRLHDQPAAAVLIAFGVGLLLSRLLSDRD